MKNVSTTEKILVETNSNKNEIKPKLKMYVYKRKFCDEKQNLVKKIIHKKKNLVKKLFYRKKND